MKEWPSSLIPLNRGLDQSDAVNAPTLAITDALNCDFTLKGCVRGRPGYAEHSGFVRKTNTAGAIGNDTVATRALTGFSPIGAFTCRDSLSETVGMVMRGRIYTFDTALTKWVDREGGGTMSSNRIVDYAQNIQGGSVSLGASTNTGAPGIPAMSYDFGFSGVNTLTLIGSSTAAQVQARVQVSNGRGPGTSARCNASNTTLMAHVSTGTNNLVLTTRVAGALSVTQYIVAADARTPLNTGDSPFICCDLDETHCYIAYASTAAVNRLQVARVTVATGVVTHNVVMYTSGAGFPRSIGISNSSVANNRVVVSYVSSTQDYTAVVNSTTMVSTGVDTVVATASLHTSVGVVGSATAVLLLVNLVGDLLINSRSMSAATVTLVSTYYGGGGVCGGATAPGTATIVSIYYPSFFIAHQPILYQSRIVVGLSRIGAIGLTTFGAKTGQWYVLDITDLLGLGVSTLGSARNKPAIVAQGPMEGSLQHWNPGSATLAQDGLSYRFHSVDWHEFGLGEAAIAVSAGYEGAAGINEVRWLSAQTSYSKSTTLIAGSVMQGLSVDDCVEVGFVENRPSIAVSLNVGAGFLAAGSYTVCAVWRWTDSSGLVHRSAPSIYRTITAALNDSLTVAVSSPQLTQKTGLYVEVYCTTVNPTADSDHFLQSTNTGGADVFNVSISQVSLVTDVLYADGSVLENQSPNASGGCTTVGNRTWVSDGKVVYGSKLPEIGQFQGFNQDDPLSVQIPATAGRVMALAGIDDKLIILCTRGIFAVVGDGPDNTGTGADFSVPELVSTLGVANQRMVAMTPNSVVFLSAYTTSDPVSGGLSSGGMFTLDGKLQVTELTSNLRTILGTIAADPRDLTWWPEREVLVLTTVGLNLVFDGRAKQWSYWQIPSDPQLYTAVAAGVLWSINTNEQGAFDRGLVGSDVVASVTTPFAQNLTLGQVPSNDDLMAWGRIRGVKVLGDAPLTHTLSMTAVLDNYVTLTSGNIAMTTGAPGSTWPTNRYAPEWRFSTQKCSSMKITLNATPAVATWTGLDVAHRKIGRAPAGKRQ